MLWSIVSKAALRSRRVRMEIEPELDAVRSLKTRRRAVSVLCFGRKADWKTCQRLFWSGWRNSRPRTFSKYVLTQSIHTCRCKCTWSTHTCSVTVPELHTCKYKCTWNTHTCSVEVPEVRRILPVRVNVPEVHTLVGITAPEVYTLAAINLAAVVCAWTLYCDFVHHN